MSSLVASSPLIRPVETLHSECATRENGSTARDIGRGAGKPPVLGIAVAIDVLQMHG